MASQETMRQLFLAAAELKANGAGAKFILALDAYVEELREACIQAAPDQLQRAQGRALEGTILLRLLRASTEEASKIIAADEAKKLRRN